MEILDTDRGGARGGGGWTKVVAVGKEIIKTVAPKSW